MRWKNVLRGSLALLLAAGILLAAMEKDRIDAGRIGAALENLGPLAPIAFVAAYAIATLFCFPGSLLTLAGGALFGPVCGAVYNLLGATLGSAMSFLASLYLFADLVASRSGDRLRPVLAGVAAEGWRFVALIRLVPLFPFNFANFALGLSRIRFLPYLAATAVCMIPGAIAWTYLGHAGRAAASTDEAVAKQILLASGAIAAILLLPAMIKRCWKAPGRLSAPATALRHSGGKHGL